jgi:arylsulfatase A
LACTMDLFVTAVNLSGAKVPSDRVIDGVDMMPILTGTGPSQREVFFYYRGTQLFAARKGRFKAHFITRCAYGKDDTQKHEPPLLYNLSADPSEQYDIAAQHPDVITDIVKEVERHRATIQPVKNQLEEALPAK